MPRRSSRRTSGLLELDSVETSLVDGARRTSRVKSPEERSKRKSVAIVHVQTPPEEAETREEANSAFKTAFVNKIREVSEEQTRRESMAHLLSKADAQGDPLGVYEGTEENSRSWQEMKKIFGLGMLVGSYEPPPPPPDELLESAQKAGTVPGEVPVATGAQGRRLNVRRRWQSDADLVRWKQALQSTARNDRLFCQERKRNFPDYDADQSELTHKHNALFRQRSPASRGPGGKRRTGAERLRDLQSKLQPRPVIMKKKDARPLKSNTIEWDSFGDSLFSRSVRKRAKSSEGEKVISFLSFILFQFNSLEDAFHSIDQNRSGFVSFTEFTDSLRQIGFSGNTKVVWRKLDRDGSGSISLREFMTLQPYMVQEVMQTRLIAEAENERNQDKDPSAEAAGGYSPEERSPVAHESGGTKLAPPVASAPRAPLRHGGSSASLGGGGAGTAAATPVGGGSPRASTVPSPTANLLPMTPMSSWEEELLWDDWPRSLHGNRLPFVRLPKTMSFSVFRNGDATHPGDAVFIGRPLASLEDLLRHCGRVCRPLVGPAEQLLDTSLRPVRAPHQLRGGGRYLIKGMEPLDPPPHFFADDPLGGGSVSAGEGSPASLRHLHRVHDVMARSTVSRSPPGTSGSVGLGSCTLSGGPSVSSPSLPAGSSVYSAAGAAALAAGAVAAGNRRVGSPPYGIATSVVSSRSLSVPSFKAGDRKWAASRDLSMKLSYGGLGQRIWHHNFEQWAPVRAGKALGGDASVGDPLSGGMSIGGGSVASSSAPALVHSPQARAETR